MISSDRNFSRDYNLQGRETVQGTLLDNYFESHTKNQHEKLLNGADIYGLHCKGDDATIKDTHLLNILAGGVYLPVPVQNILYFTGHITGDHKKGSEFVTESFFYPMNYLDPDNTLVYIHMFYGASVCRRAQKH